MTDAPRPALALTMGEPAGIGGEIALKSWHERGALGTQPFFLIDDPRRIRHLSDRLNLSVPLVEIETPAQALEVFDSSLPVLALEARVEAEPGQPQIANGPAVLEAIKRGVNAVTSGQASALVTNPINKASLYEAGFEHPGHTEYLAELAGADAKPVMMLACPGLRVVPVTIHLSLRQAADALSVEAIVEKGDATAAALRRDFGIGHPRLAVAALNPHAGESGAMGREEIDVIEPAIEKLRRLGVDASGPDPADTLFHARARENYDAVMCMYHDQALIPLKTIDFDRGVNITLGLPFVRTSPDHGTAFDIAGTGNANPSSLVEALKMAAEISSRRDG